MLINLYLEFGLDKDIIHIYNVLILLSDPEIVLEGIPFTVLFPQRFKVVDSGIPPFPFSKSLHGKFGYSTYYSRFVKKCSNLTLHKYMDEFI